MMSETQEVSTFEICDGRGWIKNTAHDALGWFACRGCAACKETGIDKQIKISVIEDDGKKPIVIDSKDFFTPLPATMRKPLAPLARRSATILAVALNKDSATARDTAKNGGKSRGNDFYLTGSEILVPIRAFGSIGLDPVGACTPDGVPIKSLVFAEKEYQLSRGEDGLVLPWKIRLGDVIYCNPPYSQTKKWVGKADTEHKQRMSEILMLVAARTGARAIQASSARCVCFLAKRLTFLDPETLSAPVDAKGKPTGAMFDSMILYYGIREKAFREVFEPYGKVVRWA